MPSLKRLSLLLALLASCRCQEPAPRPDAGPPLVAPREESTIHLAASQIVVAYRGARNAPPRVTRSRDEAGALARTLAAQLKTSPTRFAELARQHSDSGSAPFGGNLGAWVKGRSSLAPELERAIAALPTGKVSDPIETAEGYAILLRHISSFAASQILISYHGATRPVAGVKRSYPEAQALARDLVAKIRAAPQNFGVWARKHSDDGGTRKQGGLLGTWLRGRHAELEAGLDRLQIGEISDPISTVRGLVILLREQPLVRLPVSRPLVTPEKPEKR